MVLFKTSWNSMLMILVYLVCLYWQKENNQGTNNEKEIGTYHWSWNAALML